MSDQRGLAMASMVGQDPAHPAARVGTAHVDQRRLPLRTLQSEAQSWSSAL